MSTAYHPQTDGVSERTNKTINQCIRFYVERHQQGWAKVLPQIRFQLMSMVNDAMGMAPFQIRFGRLPHMIPPLLNAAQ